MLYGKIQVTFVYNFALRKFEGCTQQSSEIGGGVKENSGADSPEKRVR